MFRWNQVEIDEIVTAYRRNIGPTMPGQVAELLQDMLEAGMEPALLTWAVEQTGWAQRPSPAYLRAILARLQRDGIRTRAAAEHAHDEREGRRTVFDRPRIDRGGYLQHDYTEADFGPGFFVNLDEGR